MHRMTAYPSHLQIFRAWCPDDDSVVVVITSAPASRSIELCSGIGVVGVNVIRGDFDVQVVIIIIPS